MTAHALKIEAVEPIGTQRTHAFINRGHAEDGTALNHSFEEIEVPVYPKDAVASGRELRDARVTRGINLRDAAKLLGISVVQLSDLERGRARCDRNAFLAAMGRAE